MTTKKKKEHASLAAVVSTGCSRIKYYISSQRGTTQYKSCPPLPSSVSDQLPASSIRPPLSLLEMRERRLTGQVYSNRARQAELEINRLDENVSNAKTIRLVADGSFFHEVTVGRPWSRLALQLSKPGLIPNVFSAAEVMRSMTLMDPKELMSYMTVKLPMSEIRGKMAASSLEEMDLLESIILSTMEGIEELALEGLKIQMESSGRIGEAGPLGRTGDAGKETFVLVMRIKMKDPEAEYGTVGDEMLGFLEVPCDAEGLRNHRVQAAHVAGIRRGGGGGWFMWSASLVESKGLQRQCRFEYIRNQDIAFTHAGK